MKSVYLTAVRHCAGLPIYGFTAEDHGCDYYGRKECGGKEFLYIGLQDDPPIRKIYEIYGLYYEWFMINMAKITNK